MYKNMTYLVVVILIFAVLCGSAIAKSQTFENYVDIDQPFEVIGH